LYSTKHTKSNKYHNYTINTRNQKPQKQTENTDTQPHNKRATFTYNGKETKKITGLFKDIHMKIAFKTKNTIRNILRLNTATDKYEKSGVYQMKCMSCSLKYIGQTGRSFNTRYKEHIRDIRSKNSKPGYSSHLLNTDHTYGSITDTVQVVRNERLKNIIYTK
jgi:hypothetical protein